MHPHHVIPLLSQEWYLGMILSLSFFAFLIVIGRYALKRGFELKYRYFIAGIFIIREIYLIAYTIQKGLFTLQDSLPLHLCGISYISLVIFLLYPNFFLFEFLLLLSFAGAVQSLITPELTHGYSTYFLIDYYFSHASIIFAPMYALFVFNMRPRKYAWLRVWIFGNIVLGIVYLINLALGSNYIYLMRAPKVDNPLILHPYPMHLVGFEVFGFLHIVLIYWVTTRWLPQAKLSLYKVN